MCNDIIGGCSSAYSDWIKLREPNFSTAVVEMVGGVSRIAGVFFPIQTRYNVIVNGGFATNSNLERLSAFIVKEALFTVNVLVDICSGIKTITGL